MKEIAEFRVIEKFASKLFADDEGTKLDAIRKVQLATDDPRFDRIGELNRELRESKGEFFFHGWDIRRRYTKEELAESPCFQLFISSMFEPSAEECGTKYDESTACAKCASGAAQISELRLDLRKVPKCNTLRTLADEWIVSQRLAEQMIDAGLTGFELRPVRHKARYEDDPIDLHRVPSGRELLKRAEAFSIPQGTGRFCVWLGRTENRALWEQARAEYAALKRKASKRKGEPMPAWHQVVVTSANAEIVPPTRVGIHPFDDDPQGRCRCPLGDLIGLNLLSEVSISAATWSIADIFCSRQFIGVRRGLLRPRRVLLVSPAFRKLTEFEKLKGINIEVVHLV